MLKFIVLTQAVLIQVITGQCICNDNIPNWAGHVRPAQPGSWAGNPGWMGCSSSLPYDSIDISTLSTSNCVLPVTSSSPIAPGVLSITSENVIEGPLSVYGQLPFLSAVSFEGSLPSGGYGSVAYGCGNGNVGILSETSGLELSGVGSPNVRPLEIPSFRNGPEILPGRQGWEIPSFRSGCGYGVGAAFPPARPCGCQ